MRRRLGVVALLLPSFLLTGCVDTEQLRLDDIKKRAEVVKTCQESGGEWYNSPGWGESCHFDTRNDS